jgi:F-type H+-transporting ATPase subunit b
MVKAVRLNHSGDSMPANLPLLLGLAAEERPPPVIDIDGTILVQFALFLIMFFVLRSLLFRPFLELQGQRAARIDGARDEAQKMQAEAQGLGEEYERRYAAAKGRAEEERLRLRGEGLAREQEVLGEARSLMQLKLQTARKELFAKTELALKDLEQQAQPLARAIASRVLGREV